jgi:hypothetical protein
MNNKTVLAKAVLKAAEQLGLEQAQLEQVLNLHHTEIIELDPGSKSGQKALLLIQVFQSLYALNGGDIEWIRHFMNSQNRVTGGIPIEQIQQKAGLIKVLESVQSLGSK